MASTQEGNGRKRGCLAGRSRLLLASVAVLLILPCFGLMGGGSYLWARQQGVFSRWRSLGAPPGGAVGIAAADPSLVYVRTAQGNLYGCSHERGQQARACWVAARQPLSVDPDARAGESVFRGEPKPAPGQVVDALEVTTWYPEDAVETRYVVLQDGTVWKWEYDVGAYLSLFILTVGPAVGMLLALVIVGLLWVRAGRRYRRPRSQ
jgi:hypothetical protein